ncbi:glycoprotein hormone alpha-2 isoform X1 [Phascolarctos cinereus]|uniref:Glycoprotein hormone alpha-2 n=2 Tax=Phascolarctos cinereus TaxID=38626 RepID=A0A6P5IYP5_PHACI|nr:glycoprotein hormone alpha-2 isoform X1 [Phascolarctos cinereus]
MHTHTHAHTHTRIHAHTCVQNTKRSAHSHMHAHTYPHIYMHACTHTHIHPARTVSETHVMALPKTLLFSLLLLLATDTGAPEAGVPGCYLHPINVTVRSDRQGTCRGSHIAHACVGYCESSAFPSRHSVRAASGYQHNITSVSQCCTISRLQKVKVELLCPRSRREQLEIFTARACQCDMCRLSRY